MLNAFRVEEELRSVLPANHTVRVLEPGSVEISVSLKADPSFSCSVVYPSSDMRKLLDEGVDAVRARLHGRCVGCERRSVCCAA